MKVVLDTNIIVADFNFKKPAAKILLEQAKSGMLDVYIPEVVLDEAVNKFLQRLEKAYKDIASEIDVITSLSETSILPAISQEFVTNEVKAYRTRLEKIFLDHKISIIPYPKTDHKFLARKAMLKKKPFNANEKGYRDNLIWENVKSLITGAEEEIATSPELAFITDNHTDFMSGNSLHEDLIAELEEQGLQTETIVIYRSLHDFSSSVIKLYLGQANLFKDRLSKNEFGDLELKKIITEYLNKEYVGHDLSDFEFIAPGDFVNDEREVNAFHEDFEIHDLEVKKLSADEFVVDLRVNIETELEFFVDKSDHYTADDVAYDVIDYDWNDYVILVGQTEIIPFSVTLIINSKSECQSIEMNKIDED